ncbi:dienelactone hydrolase family protein [Chryseosolibacter indicus]|uniref:Dienelactone hydrolase family protein n=1 Tax=Chryseosolibacter indicus TaxID=2782351 RepID=A0ABS5VPF7_9BACT|nr:dienelactone hydrolase family protein [Chryseosolibacter indicus]MBT1703031.1 dienelactone hydrolase family protein [Chryseosolibacter indicus]
MKKVIILSIAIIVGNIAMAQSDAITVCHTSPTEKFAMFASNKDFNAEHQIPRVYRHVSEEGGKMIKFQTPDGKEANGYYLKAKNKTDNWILVFQEWWGLNDNIKRQSEELYKELGNVNVLALDMYDGKVGSDRETAARYMQEFKQDRGDAIVKGALQFAGKRAKVGTLGWCFGGGQSILATLNAGKQAVACVIYYGMPVDDVAKLKTLNTDVLGIFATKDKYISPNVVQKFEESMKAAGKNVTVKNYNAEHGFANPSNEIYDKEAAADAWKHTVAFFRGRLK